jgi:hypothetical protein
MIWLILLFVVILNALCIFLMFKFLKNIDKKEKFIFIVAGVAIVYVLTLFAHWVSTIGLDEMYKTGTGKDLVIFLFAPINGLIVLPALANSYYSYKENKLSLNILFKRVSVLLIPLIIAVVLECIFIKNVQVPVTNMVSESRKFKYEEYVNEIENNKIIENDISNEVINDTENDITNEVANAISEDETNDIDEGTNILKNETTNSNNKKSKKNTVDENIIVEDEE